MKYLLLTILTLILVSCSQRTYTFKVPKVVNTSITDTISVKPKQTLSTTDFPIFIGEFHFKSKVIDISPNKRSKKRNQIKYIDAHYNTNKTLQIIADYTQSVFVKKEEVFRTFPVFLINSGIDSIKVSSLNISNTFSQKVKLDKPERWVGIRSFRKDRGFCNSTAIATLILPPKSYYLLLYPKFTAGTLLPSKIQMGDTTTRKITSNTFNCRIALPDYSFYLLSDSTQALIHNSFSSEFIKD